MNLSCRGMPLKRIHLALVVPAFCLMAAVTDPAQSSEPGPGDSVASLISSVPAGDLRPVTVIDREDIALSGIRNIWDLLLSRDQYNYFGLHRPFNLGSLRAGISVNGRRISDSLYDLDSIPVSAIERIEILSSSGVAIHGPQTISGAINIVLRNEFDGVEAQVSAESPVTAGGEAGVASALWGDSVGAGHLTVGADVFNRNEIREADREYSRASWTPGGSFDDTFGVSVAGNTAIVFTQEGPEARALGPCEGSAYAGPLTEPFGLPGEACGFAYADVQWSWERRQRQTAFLMADYPVIEDVSLYLDARVVDSDYVSSYRAPVWDRIPLRGGNGFVFHRFTGHGDRASRWTVDEHDITLGAEGRLVGDIGYDVHVRSFLHDEFLESGTYVHRPAILEAIAAGTYKLQDPLSADPDHRDIVRTTGVLRLLDNVTRHRAAQAVVDGSGFELGGRPIGWAVGTEFVRESRLWQTTYVDGDGNVIEEQKDVIGSFAVNFSGERDRFSQFLELSVPLHEIWDVGLAGRYSDHDDVGSTKATQMETLFKLGPNVSLRGNWSKAGRAPYLGGLHTARVTSVPWIYDSRTEQRYQVEAVNSGNPDLEPDLAESYGAGIVTEIGPVSLSADWYWTKLSRLLTVVSAQAIVDYEHEHGFLPPGNAVHRAELFPGSGEFITRIEKPVLGSGEIDISGFNVHAHTAWETGWADFDLDLRWSHVEDYEERALDFVEPPDFVRNCAHATLSATKGNVTAQWHAYGTTGYRWTVGRYGSWDGHDIAVRWRDPYGIGGTEVIGGILNLFDAEPSINSELPEYPDESLDSIRGRTFFASLKKVW